MKAFFKYLAITLLIILSAYNVSWLYRNDQESTLFIEAINRLSGEISHERMENAKEIQFLQKRITEIETSQASTKSEEKSACKEATPILSNVKNYLSSFFE